MERVVAALTALVAKSSTASHTRSRSRDVDLGSAPPSVHALADALATHDYNVDLGELSMYAVGDEHRLTSLAPTIEMSCERGDIDLNQIKGDFDPEQTLQLGADGGGMSYFGVSWSGGKLAILVVEFDDPTEDNLLRFFATPAELFAFVDHLNRRQEGPLPALDALKAAAGIAAPAPEAPEPTQSSGLLPLTATKPSHPFARAAEHFGEERMLFQAGPTPAGRYLLARRFRAGTPPRPTAIAVVGSGGVEHAIEWDVPRDVFGVCIVPGKERALLCTGAPGALLELDLETGAQRELLPQVRWSCGFVDPDHLAVLFDGEARVYRYTDGALGEPVATIAGLGFNMFVGHGRIFHRTKDAEPRLRAIAWNGRELVEEGVFPVDSKLFTLHAAVVHEGQKLVAFVDTEGKASWFAYC